MAARSFQIALAAAAQRLSDVYGGAAGVVNAATDIPYREIRVQAAGADGFLGGSDQGASTTSTVYGEKVFSTATLPTRIGPYSTGPVKLSDLYAAGAGCTLHILAIPF